MASTDRGILAVTAHPDDEFLFAGLFSRFNKRSVRTTLVCLTCGGRIRNLGRVGSNDVTAVRAGEIRESCIAMGGTELVLGEAPDGKASDWDREKIGSDIVHEIRTRAPAIVVTTCEQKGLPTHPDHIAVHELTTEAFYRVIDEGEGDSGHHEAPMLCYGFPLELLRSAARHETYAIAHPEDSGRVRLYAGFA